MGSVLEMKCGTQCILLCLSFTFFVFVQCKNIQLLDNGYNGITLHISPHLDENQNANLIDNIKVVFDNASTATYYGSNSRAYFHSIDIILPLSWKTNRAQRTFNSMMADIYVDEMSVSLHGKMPYNEHARLCQSEGDRMNIQASFFSNLTETVETLGTTGSLITKQWMSYRYGIFEEIGFPMDSRYPSAYCSSAGGSPVVVSCSDVPLKDTGFTSIRGASYTQEDCHCSKEGSLENCMYISVADQDLILSSLMGFSQIPLNTVFCDDEYFPHEDQHPSMHNDLCDQQSTFGVVLKHYDFLYGHNEPSFVEDTDPILKIWKQALNVRVILDTKQDRDFGNNLITAVKQWIQLEQEKGVDFGSHVIFSGGLYWNITEIEFKNMQDIVYTPTTQGTFSNLSKAINNAREDFGSYASEEMPHFIILISDGTETVGHMVDAVDDAYHVHVVAIDTSNSNNVNMVDIATKSKGYYVHSGSNALQVQKALNSFTSTFSYHSESEASQIFTSRFRGKNALFSVPVDSTLKNIQLQLFFESTDLSDVSLKLENGKKSLIDITDFATFKKIPVEEMFGEWKLSLESKSEFQVDVQILGEKKEESDWIRLDCEIRPTLVNGPNNVGSRIVARAFSGNNPIINAKVTAFFGESSITLEDLGDADEDKLDSVIGDGIYTGILPAGESGPVECQMETDSESFVHLGFEPDYPEIFKLELKQPFCCGSQVPEPKTSTKIEKVMRQSQSAFFTF